MFENKKTKCKDCCYCKMTGSADAKYGGLPRSYGRGYFYCQNPTIEELKDKYGHPQNSFIGYGTPERDSQLQVKTRPRWCPLSDAE